MEIVLILFGMAVAGVLVFALILAIRHIRYRHTTPSSRDAILRLLDSNCTPIGDPRSNIRRYNWAPTDTESAVELSYISDDNGPDRIRFAVDLHPQGAAQVASHEAYRHAATAELKELPQMLLRLERPRDKWGARLGLNREAQMGDLDFDDTIYIESDAPPADIQLALADPSLRQALIDLCTASEIVVRIGADNQVTASWELGHKNSAQTISPKAFDFAATSLLQVRAGLPTFADVAAPQPQQMRLPPVVAGFLLSCASPGLVWLGHNYFPTVTRRFYTQCLVGGLVFGVFVLLPLAWLYARGRSIGLRTFVTLSLLTLWATPTTTLGAGLMANGLLDNSQRIQQATVAHATRSAGDSVTYHMQLRPWSPHRQWIRFEIPAKDYWAILGGKRRVKLTLGQGSFGAEWLRSYQLLPTPKRD